MFMTSPASTPGAGKRVVALDGVRGLAILLVLIYHQTIVSPGSADNAFDAWFFGFGGSLWFGVDLFFVLSGYLITGILWDSKEAPHYFRNFYVRRTVRIFPLYYAVVFLALVVIPNLPEGIVPAQKLANFGEVEGDEIWYWLYLSNFAIAARDFQHGILDVSWSLAIEEQFYLLWPTVVLLCSRKTLFRVCFALIAGALALRTGLALAGSEWLVPYVITPARMDLLAMGAIIALVARDPGGVETLLPWARRLAPASRLFLGGWFAFHGVLSPKAPVFYTLGYSVIGVFFGSLLVLVLCAPPGSSLQADRKYKPRFGSTSEYGCYDESPWEQCGGAPDSSRQPTHVPKGVSKMC